MPGRLSLTPAFAIKEHDKASFDLTDVIKKENVQLPKLQANQLSFNYDITKWDL